MEIPFFIVDAFTSTAFKGNPAAVCLLEQGNDHTAIWMQNVAKEMGFSETAFLDLQSNRLRWFTPAAEVDLCGHATVATAKALMESGRIEVGQQLVFESNSGKLPVSIHASGEIELDFPATPPAQTSKTGEVSSLFESVVNIAKSRFDFLVELENQQAVENICIDLDRLKTMAVRGLIVTAESDDSKYDFVSRFFAPAVGVNEDPVTGSAHCCLAPYWAKKFNKNSMKAIQLSERRGEIAINIIGDRVKLAGHAVVVVKGTLEV